MEERRIGRVIQQPQEGDSEELQEKYTQYLKRIGWNEEDFGTRQVTTEQADWLAQLQEEPEVINRLVARAIKTESDNLTASLNSKDAQKTRLKINNLKKLLDTLEKSVDKTTR